MAGPGETLCFMKNPLMVFLSLFPGFVPFQSIVTSETFSSVNSF
jgi:hypothetical protein